MTAVPNADIDGLKTRFGELGADEIKAAVMMIASTPRADGREGSPKGEAKGRIKRLVRLFDRRFGPLPLDVRAGLPMPTSINSTCGLTGCWMHGTYTRFFVGGENLTFHDLV